MTHEISQRALLETAAEGLRRIATDPRCRRAFAAPGSVLRDILAPASRRYVLAASRPDFLKGIGELRAKGYRLSAEFAPPAPADPDPSRTALVVDEYLDLLAGESAPDQLGFGLSGVGLSHSAEPALAHAGRIAAAAAGRGREIMLSMDRSATVDAVLAVHRELALNHDNVGITLQAQLHRTECDAASVARPGRRVRLVKGAFREPSDIALRRGPALDERYLSLARRLVDRGVQLSLATHDPELLAAADSSGLLDRVVEIEMLYGVQPQLLRRYRDAGHACRIHATYGTDWWLHLLQRLAEHPPMVLRALADIGTDQEPDPGSAY